MKNLAFSLMFIVGLMLLACSKTPDGVIEPHKMAMLLADIHKGEGVVELNRRNYMADTAKQALMEAIYLRHGVTQEMVDTSMVWYGHHLDEYINVYNDVMEMLQAEIDQTDAVAARIQMAAVGDSANTWNFSPRYIFTRKTPVKSLSVTLYPDENWQPGDNYTVNFKTFNNMSPVKSILGVEYTDGQIEWIENKHTETGKASYSLITDSLKVIKKVFNTLLLNPAEHEIVFIDSLSLMRTRLNSQNYRNRFSQKKITPIPPVLDKEPEDSLKRSE